MMTPEELKATGKGIETQAPIPPPIEPTKSLRIPQFPLGSSCRWPVPSNDLYPNEEDDEVDLGVDYKADFLAAMKQLDACYALLEILDNHGADNLLPVMLEGDYQETIKNARAFMDQYLKK